MPSNSKVMIVMTMIYDENEDNKMTIMVMMLMLILFVMEFVESLQMSTVLGNLSAREILKWLVKRSLF